jgi:DNA-binding FrmR family transcriptional regulator
MTNTTPNLGEQATTYLDPELVGNLQDRLSRIAGHVSAVSRMLGEQKDCDQILIQMAAIKAAMNQVIIKTLEGHISICIQAQTAEGQNSEALESLMKALNVVLKNS